MSLSNKPSHELITAEEASNNSEEIGHIQLTDKGLFFTNCIDGDLSRMAIWLKMGREKPRQVTPSCFNIRTKVHEYGGKPYIVVRNHVYFVNLKLYLRKYFEFLDVTIENMSVVLLGHILQK